MTRAAHADSRALASGGWKALADDLDAVADPGVKDVVIEDVVVAVEWYAAFAGFGAVAEESETGGDVVCEHAEVLAGHHRVGVGVDPVLAQGLGRGQAGPGDAVC